MRCRITIALAGIGTSLLPSLTADASYQGLALRLHTVAPINGINRSVWRVYAMFSDPGDFLCSVAGSPTLGNLVVQTVNSIGVAPGGNFVNPVGGGATAPTFNELGTQTEWDTFVTIGLASVPDGGNDNTGLSPGFSGIGNVSSVNTNNAGWFVPGPMPQGMAGNGVPNIIFPGSWGVLIMQLTVNAGNHTRGTVAIGGVNNNLLAGATTFQTMADQTWNTFPAPASLSLLALAGVARRTRRRRQ